MAELLFLPIVNTAENLVALIFYVKLLNILAAPIDAHLTGTCNVELFNEHINKLGLIESCAYNDLLPGNNIKPGNRKKSGVFSECDRVHNYTAPYKYHCNYSMFT